MDLLKKFFTSFSALGEEVLKPEADRTARIGREAPRSKHLGNTKTPRGKRKLMNRRKNKLQKASRKANRRG